MWFRWLLPVVAMLGLLATSLTAFAAAGVVGSAECCCPDPDRCTCHDHDEEPTPDAELKRCGGEAQLVAATLLAVVLPRPIAPVRVTRVDPIEQATIMDPDDLHARPETPPF